MKSLTTVLNPIKQALIEVSDNVGHFEAIDRTKTFIIYAEDNEAAGLEGDNIKLAQKLYVYVDLFALPRDSELADCIQSKFNEYEIPFEVISIEYESGTQYHFIHYRWRCVLS